MLNGSVLRLGTVMDVIDQVHGRDSLSITLTDHESDKFQWIFSGGREEFSMLLRKGIFQLDGNNDIEFNSEAPLHFLSPISLSTQSLIDRLQRTTYLTAERLGPREYCSFDDTQRRYGVGSRGEFAVSVLHNGANEKVLENLMDRSAPPTRLPQVEARLFNFFPGFGLNIRPIQRANAISIGIRMSKETDFLRPINTGFGLTQVLPIIVAALSSRQGDLLLIENPEMHLHPAGQAQMGRFLAEVTVAGVQVVIESHSDHILNGIRRAVRDDMISHRDIALHFFRQRDSSLPSQKSQVESPRLDCRDNVDYWPEGFFDQFDRDMEYFLGP